MISQGVKALQELRDLTRALPNLRVLILSGIVGTLGAGLLNPIFSLFLEARGLSLEKIGLVFTVGSLLPVVAQPVLGALSDRFSRKGFVIGVSLATSLLIPAFTFLSHPGPLAVILALKLILERSGAPVSAAMVGDFAPKTQRATVFAMLDAAINLMFVVALVASALAVEVLSTAGVFYLAAAFFFASSMVLFRLEETKQNPTPTSEVQAAASRASRALQATLKGLWSPFHHVRRSSTFAGLFAYQFCFTFALDLFPIFFPLYAVKLGASPAWVGPIIASSWLMYALVQPLGGRLSDRLPRRKGLILKGLLGMVVCEALLGVSGWLPSPYALPALVLAWVLLAIPDGLFRPAASALTVDLAPAHERGEILGALGSAGAIANVIAPLLYGWMAGRFGMGAAFLVSAAAFLAGFVAMLFVKEPSRAEAISGDERPAAAPSQRQEEIESGTEMPSKADQGMAHQTSLPGGVGVLLVMGIGASMWIPHPVLADSDYSVAATLTHEKLHIDGKLNEPAWQTAPEISDWHQTRPDTGKPALEQTKVRILYDRHNLYFAFHCLDSTPDKVKGYTVQNEGFLHQEDNVTVILDPYLDHRNAYYFWTNYLGVRTDGRIIDDGEAFTTDWKGEWESKGSRVDDGWIVEIRIPFSNFQYSNAPEQTWGMLLDREQYARQEWSNWTPDGVNSAKVSRYPHLTGLRDIAPPQSAYITPYVSAQVGNQPTFLPEPRVQTGDVGLALRPGLDARWDPNRATTLKLTVNPDFAQVDVDADVLWLDTEERPIAERRPFFLEGDHLFVAPIQMYFSRRIASHPNDVVLAGLQATGKYGGTAFNFLDVQTREARSDATQESINYGVLRVQQDFGKRSSVSVLGLNRQGDDAYRVLGVDANVHLFQEWFTQLQVAKNWNPVADDQTLAIHAGIHRFDTNSEYWLDYQDIGANFFNPMGFIPVLDKRAWRAHAANTFFFKHPIFKRVDTNYNGLYRSNHDGVETRHRQQLSATPYLGDHLALYVDGVMDYLDGFGNWIGTAGFIINPNDWQSLTVNALGGTFLGGELKGLNATLNLKLGPRIMARFNGFVTQSEGVPESSSLYAGYSDGYQWLSYAQLRYHFTPDLYARATFQQGHSEHLTDLNGIEGRVIDAVLGWHYREGSDAYLVYSEQPYSGIVDRRIMLKWSFQQGF